ncbi:hypothetical protein [Neisseria sp.]|mgnify:CR=1 FL=1|uniref:hypothetical protein n=1 Tax=Neisseria sp. TaxID=192066 RepID=UPI00289AFFFE|nr:hypothetical protein [Neisseria sp.]
MFSIKDKFFNFIKQEATRKKLILYWVVGVSINILYISLYGIKAVFGMYDFEEIQLKDSYVRVVGRTYDRSLLIDKQNQKYEASCTGLLDTLCTIRDNRDLFASKLQLLRLNKEKNISIVLYVEGVDFSSNRKFIIDNREKRENLVESYRGKQRLFSLVVFSFVLLPFLLVILNGLIK